jgi:hypothetical protein
MNSMSDNGNALKSVNINIKSVLDSNDEYNDNSISPTGMKNGKKINAGKVK